MRLVIAVALLALAGCGAVSQDKIVTQEVKVAVPVPCRPVLPPRPKLLSKQELATAVTAAPNFDERVRLISDQLLLYMGWVPVIEAGLSGCGAIPVPAPNDQSTPR